MARGWESKSVEEQMESAESRRQERKAADAVTSEQARLDAERDALRMQLTRIRREYEDARHDRHREQLEGAIKHLEEKLASLG
ncbi:MAG TPA: hypothetical protein VER03_03285 [Bryobacteraceae bacterium]|nr:hypothetical protein [Bryobacteraceae bacterium]